MDFSTIFTGFSRLLPGSCPFVRTTTLSTVNCAPESKGCRESAEENIFPCTIRILVQGLEQRRYLRPRILHHPQISMGPLRQIPRKQAPLPVIPRSFSSSSVKTARTSFDAVVATVVPPFLESFDYCHSSLACP